ncbi:polyprenyl diphosphate synthase [Paraburkholderia sp. A3BS-1L]|uniref:polyprenyl diphosphate synthase n=1 Tax=Paraburkholderia sp. A3BS-1L TaxID=3028375 RepID=UPI003DAA4836
MHCVSSTVHVPDVGAVPRHIAIIMDGNGRWATQRKLPRMAGHTKGVDAVRTTVESYSNSGIGYLTLFASSSENWRRRRAEVSFLMRLFASVLIRETARLDDYGIRLRIVGDLSMFGAGLRALIQRAEAKTAHNSHMTLTIAANSGGRGDILRAIRRLLEQTAADERSALIDDASFAQHLALAYAPEPDLFIRTGRERRISNFLLWQLAYTELYFTDTFWPDFDDATLEAALASYRTRERRFGRANA